MIFNSGVTKVKVEDADKEVFNNTHILLSLLLDKMVKDYTTINVNDNVYSKEDIALIKQFTYDLATTTKQFTIDEREKTPEEPVEESIGE